MKYSECKNLAIDLEELGGNREVTVKELMDEIISYRRESFLEKLLSLKTGEKLSRSCCFDSITFQSLLRDFGMFGHNVEGTIEYSITADKDCYWQLRTNISLDTDNLYFGYFRYHTEVLSTNVKRSNALTRTLMTIEIINRNLRVVSLDEIAERMK